MRISDWLRDFKLVSHTLFSTPPRRRRQARRIVAAEQLEQRLCLSSAPVISSLALQNDTGQAGDLVTEDPAVSGVVANATYSMDVEIDLDGDGIADDLIYTDANGNFSYDPSGSVSAGSVTIAARAVGYDEATYEHVYGEWVSITYTWESGTTAPSIESLSLQNDTGQAGDLVTADPTITGSVSGATESHDIEIDLDGDGIADDLDYTDANGNFTYDPSGSIAPGAVTIAVRSVIYDETTYEYVYGEWESITFTLESGNSAPSIGSFTLQNDTGQAGDMITEDATLTGSVDNATESLDIEIDLDGDGVADDLIYTDANGNFTYDPSGSIGYGSVTVYARAVTYDETTYEYIYGDWVSITFTYLQSQ